jgi:hypothetical protein
MLVSRQFKLHWIGISLVSLLFLDVVSCTAILYLFICLWFINDAVSSSDDIASNDSMISESWIEQDMKGSGCSLI